MKIKVQKKTLLLILSMAFFCLAISFWYFFIVKSEQSTDERSVSRITLKLHEELKELQEQANLIKSQIESGERPSFGSVLKPYDHPFFIYRNKGTYIWSDNSFFAPHEIYKGDYQFKVLQLRNGKYLVHKNEASSRGDLYEIFVFLPLSKEYSISNNYVSSGLNSEIFNHDNFKLNLLKDKGKNIFTSEGVFLFSLEIPKESSDKSDQFMLFLVFVVFISLLFLTLYFLGWANDLSKSKHHGLAFLVLFIGFIGIRALMLSFHFPFSFYEFDLFNSKFFASSSLAPSLGDFLLNTFYILLFSWFLLRNYYYTNLFKYLMSRKGRVRTIISVFLSLLTFYAIYFVYDIFGILSYHSQWSLDITANLDFNIFRLISILIFIASFVIYFNFTHIVFRIFLNLHESDRRNAVFPFFSGLILFSGITWFFDDFQWGILILNSFYFLTLFYLRLPKAIGRLKYTTYLYFLSAAFLCASVAAYSLYVRNNRKIVFEKQHFASDILYKNDVFGEFLLNEAIEKINNDEFIKSRLLTPLSSKSLIEHKIKRAFLPNYFDKYDVSVSIFDASGNIYDKKSDYSSFTEAVEKYQNVKYKTEYPNIFLFSDPETGFNKYLSFIDVRQDSISLGNIIIELKHKRTVPHSVYPELLVDISVLQKTDKSKFDYAVFSGQNLLYSFGNYNYSEGVKFFNDNLGELKEVGILRNGYHHIGVKGGENKLVVVSSPRYPLMRIFSNFSFYFLLLILFTILFVAINAVNFRMKSIPATYAAKIQIYLNTAFFLPLFIVSIATVSIISASYKDSLNISFVKKAEDIGASLSGLLQDEKIQEDDKGKLENTLSQMSKMTEADINLYNNKGRLLYTNQPAIFELGLLSRLINPQVYTNIIENNSGAIILPETIGKFKYNSVYVPIRSLETGELSAVLSIPYFESKNELEKQIIHVLTTIVNIFVSLFILFLFLSYIASHALTDPLRLITQKLKKTNFEKNEPIEWKTEDEIGMLVSEYNSMLVKLEESREALSKSEKESAWREMAKQVAHEIKNPLTPMKLTIQHLQRSMSAEGKSDPQTTKTLNVLLDQINNLNEIATSFSLFAKMPIPKNQRFEIASVLARTVALHNNSHDTDVEIHIDKGEYFVTGDEQLMGAIFTNLILNGVQSVPSGRKAKLTIRLKGDSEKVLIEVGDNGSGIPEHIRDKVFLPNFSTKFTGSGIGLAVAKRGVEHAKGKIWFETEENIGTTFFIQIPLSGLINEEKTDN